MRRPAAVGRAALADGRGATPHWAVRCRWGANWARQGPMTTVIFVVMESLRTTLDLDAV